MIAASVKDAEPIVDLLLGRGASVDEKSTWSDRIFERKPLL